MVKINYTLIKKMFIREREREREKRGRREREREKQVALYYFIQK